MHQVEDRRPFFDQTHAPWLAIGGPSNQADSPEEPQVCYQLVSMARHHPRDARHLGKQIKMLREVHGWTTQDLADRTRLSSAAISRYENGKRVPSILDASALAAALDVSLDAFVAPAATIHRGAHAPPGQRPTWWPPATVTDARTKITEALEMMVEAQGESAGAVTKTSEQARRRANTALAWAVLGLLRLDKRPLFVKDHPDRSVVDFVSSWALDLERRWFFEQLGAVLPIGVGPKSGQAAALKTVCRLERQRTRQHRTADAELAALQRQIDQAENRRRQYPNRPELDAKIKIRAARAEQQNIHCARTAQRRIVKAGSSPAGTASERRRVTRFLQTFDDQVRPPRTS
jgi:DNA-binding XRE family transcriptional regulator